MLILRRVATLVGLSCMVMALYYFFLSSACSAKNTCIWNFLSTVKVVIFLCTSVCLKYFFPPAVECESDCLRAIVFTQKQHLHLDIARVNVVSSLGVNTLL